jgi:hypothetical protein
MTKLQPPPDKPAKPSPIPPVNDGVIVTAKPVVPKLPPDIPVRKVR